MKIYISTPVTSRPEETFAEKLQAASRRVDALKAMIKSDPIYGKTFDEIVSTFDVNPIGCDHTESEAMGKCVELLLTCDAMLFDWTMFNNMVASKGMMTEQFICKTYGIKLIINDSLS